MTHSIANPKTQARDVSLTGFLALFTTAVLLLAANGALADGGATLLKTPENGIQPQAALDARGVLHLIYFKGDPAAGDLYYVHREAGQTRFSHPLRVNSQQGSAVAVGTIRGGQIALGKGGRVHVAWNGSSKATPKTPANGSPMLYARLNDERTEFERQRNLMQASDILDGGGTVAADRSGNVYVAWQALPRDSARGEEHRRVWVARSEDDGKTFAREDAVFDRPTGACACCGMRAFVDHGGAAYLLYRGATDVIHRDMHLLRSNDHGKTFAGKMIGPWEIGSCPMSSAAFTNGRQGVVAAWETDGQIHFATTKPKSVDIAKPRQAPGQGQERKHPAVAVDEEGRTLLVWAEGTGWQQGGALAWQVFDPSGRPTADKGRRDHGVPVWGLAAAVAIPGEGFLILY